MISTGRQHRLDATSGQCPTPKAQPAQPTPIDLPGYRHLPQANPGRALDEHTMSADPLGEPVRGTDDDVVGRLAAIDHRLHQISTQLTTLGTLLNQLEEIRTHLQTVIRSLGSVGRS
jgi:flagellin-like hook-associated protein FlgL